MKKFLLITDVEFWKENAGNAKRISQFITNITNNKIALEVVYIGKIFNKKEIEKKYLIKIQELTSLKTFLIIQIKKILNHSLFIREKVRKNLKQVTLESLKSKKLKNKFEKLYKNLNEYDGIIIEYIYLDYILPENYRGKKIIDTHDIQSDRYITYQKQNKFCRFKIFPFEEKEVLNKYNHILVVSSRDKKILENLGIKKNKIFFLPVYENIKVIKSSKSQKLRLGFIGAAIDFNIDAIIWFINNVFNKIEDKNIELHIYGSVSNLIKNNSTKIFLHGFIKEIDEAYKNIDVVINPVQVGGGIKTKNIEALSKGKFLITTTVGAQGLEDGINNAFLIADTSKEYLEIIIALLNKKIAKEKIEANSVLYIEKKLNYQKYYQIFLNEILKGEK